MNLIINYLEVRRAFGYGNEHLVIEGVTDDVCEKISNRLKAVPEAPCRLIN